MIASFIVMVFEALGNILPIVKFHVLDPKFFDGEVEDEEITFDLAVGFAHGFRHDALLAGLDLEEKIWNEDFQNVM